MCDISTEQGSARPTPTERTVNISLWKSIEEQSGNDTIKL